MNRIVLFFLSCLPLTGFTQNALEGGFFFGAMNYQGDLAEDRIEWVETQYSAGAMVRYSLSSHLHAKAAAYFGKISGDDQNAPRRFNRQFSMEANLFETSLQFELYPFGALTGRGASKRYRLFSPYLFTGVGLTLADAQVDASLTQLELLNQPVPEDADKATFLSLPVGAGLRIGGMDPFSVSLELGWRNVFSDYLDGISQNGRPEFNDWYLIGGIYLTYLLNPPSPLCKF